MKIAIQKAQSHQIEIAFEMLKETALWIGEKNINQWKCWIDPTDKIKDIVVKGFESGEFYFAYNNNEIVGMYRLTNNDEWFWQDNGKDNAVYLHQFTTMREYKGKGLGGFILAEIENNLRKENVRFLRFDCYAQNKGLCDWYEKNGFVAKGIKL